VGLAPALTPHGRLQLEEQGETSPLAAELSARLTAAFARGPGHGLLQLGAGEVGQVLPPALSYWRSFGCRYVTAVCAVPDLEERRARLSLPAPRPEELEELASLAPVMTGAEYVSAAVLTALWQGLDEAFRLELNAAGGSVQAFLKGLNPVWNLVGRVHFHLAENRKDDAAPFAFLATYTDRLSAHAKAQHLPLGQALRQYAGAADKERLLNLLLPVQRAAESCPWLKRMVETGELFHPLRWRPADAFQLLRDIPALESAGVVVRVPAAWPGHRPPRPQVSATVGGKAPAALGRDALLDFELGVSVGGEPLSDEEVRQLLASAGGLAMIRGRWVEVDPDKLRRMLERYQEIQRAARRGGVTFAEAMRMLSGAEVADREGPAEADPEWSKVVAGPWLAAALKGLRSPEALAELALGQHELRATLRPYQEVGVRWLHLLARLGLGGCLADDMGLGKTIQVLALLLVLRRQADATRRPSLLLAPASLLANWAAEIARFAPGLQAVIAHPSAMRAEELRAFPEERRPHLDLVITSYGSLLRLPWLATTEWDLLVLDEAQAIKNPEARQTRAAKQIQARVRLALTGTPVENRLGDLWSIFDCINPGLLGSARAFAAFARRLADRPHNPYGPLRELVRPYVLRRLKTDKTVIADLPDKTEVKAYCQLSRRQAALYQQAVDELTAQLEGADGIQRKGVVLAALMRLKQICNHPSQWLGDGAWGEADSGKWQRLRELTEVIAGRQEKVLVFTQFREVIPPLAAFLGGVFGRPGLVLHGETEVRKRKDLVRQFQEDEAIPFFLLSLKAGGSGLNLTAASHVVHFDRWWNPAVENQATDRAFRIGQTRNVLVHKFVCRGTVEEKIDQLIESKKQLSQDLLEGGAEVLLTELADDELLRLVALDLNSAMQEG
jgi:non-specific serine/threonine protein kinase